LTQNPVKALGIFFGHNQEECQKLNWEKKIKEMKNQFTAWRKRNLTIIGKHFLIIYTFILPKFTKYFRGITFQFDVSELSSFLTYDTLSDLKKLFISTILNPLVHNTILKLIF
jgi:hypothetical protein